MRIVVTGATGNVGTSLVAALGSDDRVSEIVGIARRAPAQAPPKVRWVTADVARDYLAPAFEGADAVVHLAWAIQPSHDLAELERVNVEGSRRVFRAAAAAHARALVYASSIGAYSPGPDYRPVDESWPTDGVRSSFYSRHKAAVERALDELEQRDSALRVVRLRPGLIFKREAASEIRRLFGGPLVPSPLVRPGRLRVVPHVEGLRLQAVHADDVGEAYRLAVLDERARGAYNVAAEPVFGTRDIAEALGALAVPVSARFLRAITTGTWQARMQPTPPGWLDMGLAVPVMDTTRIRTELGWSARVSALEALCELLDGMSRRAGAPTPPLDPAAGGPLRVREFLTGVGGRAF